MNDYWLLDPLVAAQFRRVLDSGFLPSADQIAEIEARVSDGSGGSPIMSVAGDTARITVQGVLTERPSWLAAIFGGGNTTYSQIIQALAEAESDPAIRQAELHVNSGGGQIAGLFETLAAEEAFSKPLVAKVGSVAASAAYALASQADSIEAANPATRVGSIGVVVEMYVDPDTVSITSTNAPKKRPDVSTEEGKAMVREELDDLHAIFVDAIATGRNTTSEKVNAEFGQGGVFLAGKALKNGMIDRISGSIPGTKTNASKTETVKSTTMTLAELKAQFPEVFQAAVSEGVEQERKRAADHLKVGKASGAMDVAIKAISEGTPFADLQADYMAANMRRKETEDRQDDADGTNAVIDGADKSAKDKEIDDGDQTFAAFSALRNADGVI